ncbi:hypothetical protein [Aureimonas mangrovi]|uniref:hypothetical protein n=1 Tax=Aureimonas mangrovi TaxID=2758041 RepID=UPI00163D62D1|nr:hypothetical protein [Aureimonas mangrovi]
MIPSSSAFAPLPPGLRTPLVDEYRSIIQNYAERRWGPSELSGGRFCEIVYTILQGYASGVYPNAPSKPSNFLNACRQLETQTQVPRSFQILIPRMLPALYEVRNNRGVGHVGGDVDPNHMDATAVVGMCNWIMAELVRVLHALGTEDAQALVDVLADREVPLVWQMGDVKRVLDPGLSLHDQVLILLTSSPSPVETDMLWEWTMYKNRTYFKKILRKAEDERFIYISPDGNISVLPPGSAYVSKLVQSMNIKIRN